MKFKKTFVVVGIIFIAILCIILFLGRHVQITSATVNPEVIVKNIPQEITVWVATKPTLLPSFLDITAVLVEQKDEYNVFNGNEIVLGRLVKQKDRDNDGNNVYKGIFSINNPKAETVQIQLKDNFGRNITPQNDIPMMRLAISTRQFTLPPDPGEAGKSTLEGIDSDKDGLRDDIQREIFFAYPESERIRRAQADFQKLEIVWMMNADNPDRLNYISYSANKRGQCVIDMGGISSSTENITRNNFISEVLWNTKLREEKSNAAVSHIVGGLMAPPEELGLGNCLFDPNSLPD